MPWSLIFGSQTVDMVSNPTRVAKNSDVVMEAVFGMVGLVSCCLKHLGAKFAFLLSNRCAPFFKPTHRGKTFQRFAKAGIIQVAASLEPNIKHSVVFAGSYELKLMDERGGGNILRDIVMP
jgi:hypothetical protein